jgi:hypothetical protein
MTDFERLTGVLAGERTEFIIVGGLAATAHGSARLTRAIDVVYSRPPRTSAAWWTPSGRCDRTRAEPPTEPAVPMG